MDQELENFYMQLPPELQDKINAIQDEQQRMEVLASLYQRYLQTQGQAQGPEQGNPQVMGQEPQSLMGRYGLRAEEGANPGRQQVDVEAERNENITVQDGMIVPTEGGYLQELSSNPITGQATYEIPDNNLNQTHEQGGVDVVLKEGDVVNSDKTKIPFDFKIGKSNFKNKTFKEASDKISSLEKKAEKELNYLVEKGKADDITEQSFEMNFAKYGRMREELNSLQETVLELNNQIESNEETNSILAKYGTKVKAFKKAESNYYNLLEGYTDKKRGIKKEHVYKAEKGLNATISNLHEVIDYARNNNLNPQEINEKIISTGILNNNYTNSPQKSFVQPFSYNPSSDTIQQFKDVIASQESGTYENPYMAIGGLKEKDAMVPFESTKGKRASSAIGKYQFIWSIWKKDIKKQTGIEDPDEFRNNPSAQEQFMDWYTKNDLMPKAIKAKQKYQIPMNVYEIMAAMHLEGEKGFIRKYTSGQMNKSTMAGNFKNASPAQYSGAFSQFPEEQEMRYGGKLYADGGTSVFSLWRGDNYPPNKPKLNLPGYELEDVEYLNNELFQGQADSNKRFQELLYNKYKEDTGNPVYRYYDGKIDESTLAPLDGKLGDDPRIPINYYLAKLRDRAEPSPEEGVIEPVTQGEGTFAGQVLPTTDIDGAKKEAVEEVVEDPPGVGYVDESGTWWEKLNHGVNRALPYANALSLLMEKKINPTLQQKRARYTPLNTDVDVQPQMNEIQRMYNMSQSDTRGNPSLRAARMAQIASNATGNINQVLSGKYNQEQQWENQEILRRDSYFNNLDDYNRQLMKQYETEVLQTDENARQQRRGAAEYMANLKLRESEQDKATALALSNTVYDYDPVTGRLVRNPMKVEQHFMQEKLIMQYQNLLAQKQAEQEALLKAKDKDERKSIEERIKVLEKEAEKLSPSKKYGGKIKKAKKKGKEKEMFYNFDSY